MEKHVYLSGKRGFTLIELMVVVAIIGILMAAGIVSFSGAQRNARDSKARSDMDSISKALEQYMQDNGTYPYVTVNSDLVANWDSFSALAPYLQNSKLPRPLVYTEYYYLMSISQNYPGAANPKSRYCAWARLPSPKGNCSGVTSLTTSDPNSFQCAFVTPGTGTYYCVQDRQ